MIIQRKLNKNERVYLSFLYLLCLFLLPHLLAAQENVPASNETPDSLSLQITYEVKFLKLEVLWPEILNISEFSEIIELKIFAEEAYQNKDFTLALIYLEEIFSILDEKATIAQKETSLTNRDVKPAKIVSIFEKEVLTGMDFSKQEYNLTYSEEDTAYIETINNPFGGLKLRWNQYLLNEFDFEVGGLFKYSRDYSLWQANAQFEKSNLSGFIIRLNQQGEGMKYQSYFKMQYWQSLSGFRVEKKINRILTLQFEDEFQYRNYMEETETFATYWHNEYQFLLRAGSFWNSRFLLSFEKDRRRQKTFTLYDYDDQRINFQHYFNPSWRTSFSGWYQFKTMDYPQFVSDSSFVADYTQHFISLNLKQNIQEKIAIRLFAEGYNRDYPESSIFWPDYQYVRAEPGLRIEVSEKLTFGVDYLIELKKFKKNANQASNWFLNEDFFAEGIILSIDFFDYKNWLISLNHTFRLNSYPNAPDNIFPGLSLYTDRRQNSTMLFLSYRIFTGLELNLILQHDLDKDMEIQNNNSRSSIFTMDFTWNL